MLTSMQKLDRLTPKLKFDWTLDNCEYSFGQCTLRANDMILSKQNSPLREKKGARDRRENLVLESLRRVKCLIDPKMLLKSVLRRLRSAVVVSAHDGDNDDDFSSWRLLRFVFTLFRFILHVLKCFVWRICLQPNGRHSRKTHSTRSSSHRRRHM